MTNSPIRLKNLIFFYDYQGRALKLRGLEAYDSEKLLENLCFSRITSPFWIKFKAHTSEPANSMNGTSNESRNGTIFQVPRITRIPHSMTLKPPKKPKEINGLTVWLVFRVFTCDQVPEGLADYWFEWLDLWFVYSVSTGQAVALLESSASYSLLSSVMQSMRSWGCSSECRNLCNTAW